MRLPSPHRALAAALSLCLLAGCEPPAAPPQAAPPQAAMPDPVPFEGVGYLLFNAPILPASRDLFIADVDKFRAAGAREIDLALNSPGGDIDAAQGIVDYMNRLHEHDGITFKAYNVGLVSSAATFLFLNAQNRYSVERGVFLFHAAGMVSNGPVSAERLREQADKLEAYERIVGATLKARTRLTASEAQTYLHRTVVLNSDDARRDGIVDAIAAFPSPKGSSRWVILFKPAKPGTAAAPASRP